MAHGSFVWYELMTTDTKAAKAFYGSVIGWGAQSADQPSMEYTMLKAGENPVAGLMTLPEEVRKAGGRPGRVGYVAVDDVDTSAAQVTKEGGTLHRPPNDIPGMWLELSLIQTIPACSSRAKRWASARSRV